MRQLYVPALGDELTLVEPWRFTLHREYRNQGLIKVVRPDIDHWKFDPQIVTLPTDTVLIVDRIYIKKGGEAYNSLTFRIKECPNPLLTKKRFWAKLHDVNTMVIA